MISAHQFLSHWRDHPEFASVHDEKQQNWQPLWSDVSNLLKKSQQRFTKVNVKDALTILQPTRRHQVLWQAGVTYVIQLESHVFDTVLVITDAHGNVMAQNDDTSKHQRNSRVVVTPQETGTYNIVAQSYQQRGQGAYSLTMWTTSISSAE